MSNSLYDISVGSYLQALSGMAIVLEKGAAYATENGVDPDTFVGAKLHDDMLPFLFQVNSARQHSVDALESLKSGECSPPKTTEKRDYKGLQKMISDSIEELKAVSADEVNSAQGKTVVFRFGKHEMPFTAENFILSFSLPNLNFHITTAYDILRMKGVPLGKGDFLGKMRIGV
ncbi:MAG: hypothetical protein ACI854_001538 [Arenicella sp.]|jgi:hypothetical protein